MYRVISDTSTRASTDPAAPEYEQWVHFRAGQRVSSWPEHAPVEEWVTSGHWVALAQKGEALPGPMVGVEVPADGTFSEPIEGDGPEPSPPVEEVTDGEE